MKTSKETQHQHAKLQTSQDGIDKNIRFLAAIVLSSDDAIIAETLDGVIMSWNPAAERMFGYTSKEAVGKSLSIIEAPDLSNELKDIIEKVRKGVKVERFETQRKRKNGTLIDVVVTASPVKDANGQLQGVSLIDRDNTVQKQASQYARSLIEASLDPLVTISAEGKIMDVNEATVKVTGVAREKLIGTNFSSYFTEPDRAEEGYKLVLTRGFVTDYPLTIRNRDGILTDVLYNASVYRDTAGQVLGVFAAARDITVQKKAEGQLAIQRAKELERLAELERFQRLTVGRELKMIELKKEIEDLKKRLGESDDRASN
jgi:PAS domain S-box-containing protein